MTARGPTAEVGCHGKHPFQNSGLAKEAAQRMRNRDKSANVYRCTHCGHWHIGSRSKPRDGKKKRRHEFSDSNY